MNVDAITITILAIIVLFQEFRLFSLTNKLNKMITVCAILNEADSKLADAVKEIVRHLKETDTAVQVVLDTVANFIKVAQSVSDKHSESNN